ncbi:pyridoxamine 5'-phosphate oxidase family protein [Streptomyces griseobrunneus]|uniref:pyridoxamine 5'-phosphate oxidase family protein n=1 Tax=Streptomyces microflavus TaxID=1919 RepID=UPI0037FF47C4
MADYHDGELAVQHRAGLRDPAAGSLRAIRDAVPDAAAVFLARQPMIVVGAADASGRLWSTLLDGEPGFLGVPDPRTLTIGALPAADDPLGAVLRESGTRVGMIAIEPATRRRIRLNGTSSPEADGVRIALDQVIGNCPKYLQKRDCILLPPDRGGRRTAVRRGAELTTVQQLTLATSDSFFIATASPDGDADASHRGGNPGFLQVLSPTRLRWPDYAGNAMFLTLGNLELHPEAGLLVPDWETGDLLQLSGTAHTVWDGAEAAAVPGVQRIVEFRIKAVQETRDAVRLRWSDPDFSRFNPPVAPG